MNKFSMRSLPAALALTAALATLAVAAHAQVGVRTGTNGNIDSDTRMKAENAAHGSSSTSASAPAQAAAPASGGGVKGALSRTGHKAENLLERGADATKRGVKRAESAVGNVASKADRGIQGALPANAAGKAPVNVQGTGSGAGQISPPPQ
jgi:hypothetical protein